MFDSTSRHLREPDNASTYRIRRKFMRSKLRQGATIEPPLEPVNSRIALLVDSAEVVKATSNPLSVDYRVPLQQE